jgi:hypothetical protein
MQGAHLLDRLEAQGANTEALCIDPALPSQHGLEALIAGAAESDPAIISALLYVDALPAAVAEYRRF